MTTVYDVPTNKLIEKLAFQLKENADIQAPEWAPYVKTGIHCENPPVQHDWWHTRVAAVLRKVYIHSPIGINHLAAMFGGRRDRLDKPYRARAGSRAIVRLALQQLERAGYIANVEKKGRIITPKGQAFLDKVSHEVLKEAVATNPELSKY